MAERMFFAASVDGSIYQVNLFRQRDRGGMQVTEAVGGAGVTDIIRVGDEETKETNKRLISVGYAMNSLCPSYNSGTN